MPDPHRPIRWQPTSTWADIAAPGRGGAARGEAGVHIAPLGTTHALSIVARPSSRESLARIVDERFGTHFPAPGRLAEGRGSQLVWSGPDHWLLVTQAALPAQLRHDLESAAAITDQSSARALLDVFGPDAGDVLAKGFAIDLHPAIFVPGHTAVTSVAHISVQIWQRTAGRYTIAIPRSFASSFWSWLTAASAVYGYEIAA